MGFGTQSASSITGTRVLTDEYTAFAGGGQANAVVVAAFRNYITVVATTNDSVKLPTAVVNLNFFIKNKGVNSMRLFPNETENFDGLAENAHIDFPAGGVGMMFVCYTVGVWEVEV